MEKDSPQKRNGAFIIRDHYQNDGAKAKEMMEQEIYRRIIDKLD